MDCVPLSPSLYSDARARARPALILYFFNLTQAARMDLYAKMEMLA